MASHIQNLLDHEAWLSNNGRGKSEERKIVHREIMRLRGSDIPGCHGEDDCSTSILSMCPFRIDCGGSILDE